MEDVTKVSFPFLIGKVLTDLHTKSVCCNGGVLFPFLIGKVLTKKYYLIVDTETAGTVSIPYR